MYHAIITKFAGPTNHRGSRIIANCAHKRAIVSCNHALNGIDNHRQAAVSVALLMGYDPLPTLGGPWYMGEMPDGTGYAFVRVEA
jgi:hypothetical protein